MSGRLITFEGGEGAGKSTVIGAVLAMLQGAGIDHLATREPGGTAFGETIRGVLLGAGKVSPEAELLAMFAARAQHLDEVVRPALEAGKWVVCDRYVDSSYAYQGGGRRIALSKIEALERAFASLVPDVTVYLDIPPEIGLARLKNRGGGPDRIEREELDFFKRVREAYLDRTHRAPKRFVIVDATQSAGEVAAAVTARLIERMSAWRTLA